MKSTRIFSIPLPLSYRCKPVAELQPRVRRRKYHSCKAAAIGFIQLYRYLLSPIVTGVLGNGGICRFHPSCSEYAIRAISQYGLRRGGILSFKRILRCCPGVLGGYDPAITPHI